MAITFYDASEEDIKNPVKHRGIPIIGMVQGLDIHVHGIEALIVLLEDGLFYIVAQYAYDDDVFEDLGPFPTMEDAIIHARLCHETAS